MMDNVEMERAILRAVQSVRVMDVIGDLLDGWDALPNDVRSDIEAESPLLTAAISAINAAMDDPLPEYEGGNDG